MRRPWLIPLASLLAGCSDLPLDLVSVQPIHGWVDGCRKIIVSGHGFGDTVEATIGGETLEDITYPDATENPLDVGFMFYATVPASSSRQPGYAALSISSDGQTDQLDDAFFFKTCHSDPFLETYTPDEDLSAGTTVTITGCNLDTTIYHVRVGDSDDIALNSTCGTAVVSFEAPDLEPGEYYVGLFDSQGQQVYPDAECDISIPVGGESPDTGMAGPASNDDLCSGTWTLSYEGGQ